MWSSNLLAHIWLFLGVHADNVFLELVLGCESLGARVAPVWFVLVGQVDAADVQVKVVVVGKVLGAVWALGTRTDYFQVNLLDVLPQVIGT